MGVLLARDETSAVLLQQGPSVSEIHWSQHVLTSSAGDMQPNNEQTIIDFKVGLAELKPPHSDKYLPVAICLSDPHLKLGLFEFDVLPSAKKSLKQLIRWRLAEKFQCDVSTLHYSYQVFNKDKLKPRVLVQAIDKHLIAMLQQYCEEQNWQLESVDSALSNQLNLLNGWGQLKNSPAALLTLQADSWTLVIWDQQAQPCYVRSQWRDVTVAATEFTNLAAKLTHALTASAFAINADIEHLYILAPTVESEELCNAYSDSGMQLHVLSDVSPQHVSAKQNLDNTVNMAAVAAAFRC